MCIIAVIAIPTRTMVKVLKVPPFNVWQILRKEKYCGKVTKDSNTAMTLK
jgi:hypothetical protein